MQVQFFMSQLFQTLQIHQPECRRKKNKQSQFSTFTQLNWISVNWFQYNQKFLFLRNFLRMSFLSSRLFPLTRIVSLKARQSLLRGISQNSTAASSKETLLMSDSCVEKLRDICDGQFLRVTVSRIYLRIYNSSPHWAK